MYSNSGFFVLLVVLVATLVKTSKCDARTEAIALALEASNELKASNCLVNTIVKDLKAIRAAYKAVRNIFYSPPWAVGVLLAQLSDEQLKKIRTKYGGVTSSPLFGDYKKLTFKTPYNPELLAKELTSKQLVVSAEPDYIIGISNSIDYNNKTGIYKFSQGWGDCFAGCIKNHYWEFSVGTNGVQKLNEYGTPLGSEAM